MEQETKIRSIGQVQALRLTHTGVDETRQTVTDRTGDSFSDALPMESGDPRWIAAARLQIRIQTQLANHSMYKIETEHREMLEQCARAGFSPMHSEVMVQIVRRACTRGGLDGLAMDELSHIPLPDRKPSMSSAHKLMVWTTLCIWSIGIAGLMVLASRVM